MNREARISRIVVFSYFGPGSKLVSQPLNPNKLLIAQKGETNRLPLHRPFGFVTHVYALMCNFKSKDNVGEEIYGLVKNRKLGQSSN